MADTGERQQHRERPERGATSRWEWVIAALGALVVVGALAIMVHTTVVTRRDPLPRISVQVDSVAAYRDGHVVRLRVINDGGETAAHVVVHGVLRADTGDVERSETSVDYVPANSTRKAGLLFTKDPRAYRLEVRAVGYEEP